MSALQIVCQNCGAKYKLPESFQGDKAKCKACGAVIDVAAQRGGGDDAPAPAQPAAARPAKARPATAKSAAHAEATPRRAGASRRASKDDATGEAGGHARRGGGGGRRGHGHGHEPKKKGVSPMLVGGILLVVAIGVVGAILAFGGKGEPADQTDQTAATASGTGGAKPADPKTADPKPADTKPADTAPADTKPADAEPAAPTGEDPAAKPAETKPAEATVKPADTRPSGEITSRDDVFDPKTLARLEYPEAVSAELRAEIDGLVDDVVDGGLQGARAKRRLEEIGFYAIFGIVNKLREIDYFDTSDSMTGYELNRLLEAMAVGINVGYRPPQIGEEQKLEDVDWNAKTAKAWHRLPELYPTPERFAEMLKTRQTRHEAGR